MKMSMTPQKRNSVLVQRYSAIVYAMAIDRYHRRCFLHVPSSRCRFARCTLFATSLRTLLPIWHSSQRNAAFRVAPTPTTRRIAVSMLISALSARVRAFSIVLLLHFCVSFFSSFLFLTFCSYFIYSHYFLLLFFYVSFRRIVLLHVWPV